MGMTSEGRLTARRGLKVVQGLPGEVVVQYTHSQCLSPLPSCQYYHTVLAQIRFRENSRSLKLI
jgi:hypothetical protein